jgi:UDP-glucose 4-epimerase
MSNILVTGGAGFIGSFLAERLLDAGHTVRVLDDLSTGDRTNIAHLEGRPGFRFIAGSIMDELLLEGLVAEAETICHLAAAVGVKFVVENPVRSIITNTRGAENVLRLAAARGRRVFIASSSEVYGRSRDLPFREDGMLVFGPTQVSRWSYAASKAVDEFLALAYAKESGLDVRVGRLFNICGPRQTGAYGMVIPRFITQALRGEPLTVYGDGLQKRSFTYVDDAVTYIAALTASDAARGGVYNIGSGNTVAILDLARMIKALTASSSAITFVPYAETYEKGFEDMENRIPDTTRLAAVCPDVQPLGLEEILRRTIAFHRERR